MWNGQLQMVAVDYDRYVIIKFCYLELNKCKYVFCDVLNEWQSGLY